MNFAERLSSLMAERGLNKLRLAEETGLSDSLVGGYAKGAKVPNLRNALILANYFEVSLDYLVGRTSVREVGTKKAPASVISENGREMLEFYERLSERDQLLLLGRLQEMETPLLSSGGKRASDGKAG